MKRILRFIYLPIIAVIFFGCAGGVESGSEIVEIPEYREANNYLCFRAPQSLVIDGRISSEEWDKASWSVWFKDIEGEGKPEPRFKTRMKMLWDDNYLYVAAELEEPHVWANITKRDEVIFYDNDFEVFIDPDDDTHAYYELEVNALETAWDLMLIQPYRDGGPAVDSWDIQGLKVGTEIKGTINNPDDIDTGWTVEIAIPFKVLEECAPGGEMPIIGDQWRINFSRVEWKVEVKNGKYQKIINPETGKAFPEDNWVWSPQGFVNMHMPEYWGYVQFEGDLGKADQATFDNPKGLEERWILRNLYYRQFNYKEENGKYATSLKELDWPVESLKEKGHEVILEAGSHGFQAYNISDDKEKCFIINERGRIVKK